MIEFFKDFFVHKESFVGYVRGGVLAAGAVCVNGQLPTTKEGWFGLGLLFFGGMIRAGEKNTPPVEG